MSEWLQSENGLAIVGGVMGFVWAAFRSSAWWKRRVDARHQDALLALEAGAARTYEVFVREIKRARSDGKLTDAERRRARALALEAAIAFGRERGVDVLRTLGTDYIDLHLARVVQRLKGQAH